MTTISHSNDGYFPCTDLPPSRQSSRADVSQTAPGWEDLTERVRAAGMTGSAFDGDPSSEALFDEVARALHRAAPRHVLIIRERGVGELAVLLELARRALLGRPAFLRSSKIVLCDCRLVAVEVAAVLLKSVLHESEAGERMVVCLDGVAALLPPPGPQSSRARVIELLATAPSRVVGIVTPEEYEERVAADVEYQALFSVIRLQEPELPLARRLVRKYADGLARQYDLRITDAAVTAAVDLSAGLMLHDRLPLKAVKMLRSVCDDIAYDRADSGQARELVDAAAVIEKIAAVSGVPVSTLTGLGDRIDYCKHLGDVVYGQPHAVNQVALELGLIKAGLVDHGKPASVLLFIGQTGTGKTELAKALAKLYSPTKRLKTFTLGNFSEPHSVSGLIGVPAGYVGHDQGGRLVNELNADPYSVFLLDEADKAHPDVMQPFLNLFDEGWLYDQRGVKAHAGHAIFVITTNVGQRQIADLCKQGKGIEEITAAMKEALSRIRHTKSNRAVFTPEFLARVKRVIVFRSLDAEAMSGICGKLIRDLATEWQTKRHKQLRVSDDLVAALASEAHEADERSQGREGGRIARKLIADRIELKIQAAISEDTEAYRAADTVEVSFEGGGHADSPVISGAAVTVRFHPPAEKIA